MNPYLLATKLAPDAVVAYHAALQFRGRAYSVWHHFSVLSQSHPRRLVFQGNEFVPTKPPRALPHGFRDGINEEVHSGGIVRVTTFERTMVDMLDKRDLGGGWEEIWRSLEMVEFFDLDTVLDYTFKLQSALTAARVGFFLEQHKDVLFVEDKHLERLRKYAPRQARYFDRTSKTGRLVKPWNLIVPEQVLGRTWEEVI